MQKIIWMGWVLYVWGFVVGTGILWAQDDLDLLMKESKARAAIVKKVRASVVHLRVEVKTSSEEGVSNPYESFDEEFLERFGLRSLPETKEFKQEGLGSGALIRADGYIVTNHHVVGRADKIIVKFDDDRQMEGKLMGTDPQSDIAVIKVDATNLPVMPLGNSDEIDVGESVIAIGNPFGLDQTVTYGIISAKGRSNVGITDYEDFIQTDAAINPGNSGGPLLNLKGEMIGVNTAIASRNGGYQGIGFAVPINMARRIVEDLIETGSVSRGWLGVGIQDLTPDLAQFLKLPNTQGTLITGVVEGTPAAKAGFRKGDVILKFNQYSIRDSNQLRNLVAESKVGSQATLQVLRNGKSLNILIALSERPKDPLAQNKKQATPSPDQFGVVVQDLTPDTAKGLGFPEKAGALVANVVPGSPAAQAGLRPGMLITEINQKAIQNRQEFHQAIAQANLKEGVLILVHGKQGARYLIVKRE